MKNHLYHYRLAILSGILIGTSYIPFPPWAILFCFVPLWIQWLRASSYKEVFISGWITQFILALIGFHWVAYTATVFGRLPPVVGGLTLILFASLANLFIPLAGVVCRFLLSSQIPSWTHTLCFAITTAFAERIYPMIFPWNLGYTWVYSGLPIYQSADIWGVEGLSLITFLFNGFFFWFVLQQNPLVKKIWSLGLVIMIFLLLNLLGLFEEVRLDIPNRHLNVSFVQANIGNQEKIYAEYGREFRSIILDKYIALSRTVNSATDLIVWPESAFPDAANTQFHTFPLQQKLKNFVQTSKMPLLTGAFSREQNGQKSYNSLFLFNADGKLAAEPYRKTILLAFGEYIPGSTWFPILNQLIPQVGTFDRGSGPTITKFGDINLGLQICYEGLAPEFTQSLIMKGAHILFNATNDSWFGLPFEPNQHLYMTAARAVEFRRPLIRSTNTGYSTTILPNGNFTKLSPLHKEWVSFQTIPYWHQPPITLYAQWGIYNIYFIIVIWVIMIVFCLYQKNKKRNVRL